MKIFVQIASYRDPQLIPTIENMLENAKRPKNLVIGVARQFHPEDGFDDLSKYKKDKRFRILDIPYTEYKGVCWDKSRNKWKVQLAGKHLGRFENFEDAVTCRNAAVKANPMYTDRHGQKE